MTLAVVETHPDEKRHRLLLAKAINTLRVGSQDVAGSLTLTANAASTTVEDNLFESESVPVLIPTSANAAAALATTYLSSRTKGSFTLTHANNAQADKTFLYVRFR